MNEWIIHKKKGREYRNCLCLKPGELLNIYQTNLKHLSIYSYNNNLQKYSKSRYLHILIRKKKNNILAM
jgi:hypothetical protein